MKLKVANARFQYPGTTSPVFKDLEFQLSSGEVLAILGRNGIGKTTLVKCLTGIYKWTSASITIDGVHQSTDSLVKRIGYVPQSAALTYPYTVRELVLMGRARHMGALSIPSKRDRQKTDAVISALGIRHLADQRCDELSGGQLQMVLIARALAGEPQILVMDEPETGLDFKNQSRVMDLITSLTRDQQIACVINTHFPNTALTIASRALLLGPGDFISGPVADIVVAPTMDRFFDVRTAITFTEVEGREYGNFIVLGDRPARSVADANPES